MRRAIRLIQRYGLSLSRQDVQALVVGRVEALEESDRVEFGGGVAKDLVLAFAGSPYVSQSTFVETILELQELFYEFKNESLEQIPDEELIAKMRSLFDDFANGDVELLAEALLDGLAASVREEAVGGEAVAEYAATAEDDAADPDADRRRSERAHAGGAPLRRVELGRRRVRTGVGGLELAGRIGVAARGR